MCCFVLSGAGLAVISGEFTPEVVRHGTGLLWFLCLLTLGGAIGWFCGVIAGSCILGPLHEKIGRWNGAPYQIGDRVQILTGPNRDHVVQVRAASEDCNLVWVEMGEQSRKDGTDMFSGTEVSRRSS